MAAAPELHDDGHLDWRISALLDGELEGSEELVARRHLTECDLCQQEFAEVTAARSVIRGLGQVEPPAGSIDRMVRRLRRREQTPRRLGVVGLVTVAVAWVLMLVIGAGVLLPTVAVEVGGDVADHLERSAPSSTREGTEAVSGELPAPFVAPEELPGGFVAIASYREEGGIQVLYEGPDGAMLSVFEREGTLDWSSLGDGQRVDLAGGPAWQTTVEVPPGGEAQVVVAPRGSIVYAVVGDGDADIEEVVGGLPDGRSYSYGERVRQNVDEFLRRIGVD